MPTKRSGTQQPPEAGPSYAEWRAHVAALLVRQSLLLGVMRERDWQRLYKCGVTPEDAADRAQVAYYNTRPAFGRVSKR
jgi:beta-lactamase class A